MLMDWVWVGVIVVMVAVVCVYRYWCWRFFKQRREIAAKWGARRKCGNSNVTMMKACSCDGIPVPRFGMVYACGLCGGVRSYGVSLAPSTPNQQKGGFDEVRS
jgi:hypothetical protein